MGRSFLSKNRTVPEEKKKNNSTNVALLVTVFINLLYITLVAINHILDVRYQKKISN